MPALSRSRRCRGQRRFRRASCARRRSFRPCRRLRSRPAWRRSRRRSVFGLLASRSAKSRRMRDRLAQARLERLIGFRREVGRLDLAAQPPRDGRARRAPWASSRSGAARDGRGSSPSRIADLSSASSAWPTISDPSNSCRVLDRMRAHVERNIAVADHRGCMPLQRRIEVREIGMAVVPADELAPSRPRRGGPRRECRACDHAARRWRGLRHRRGRAVRRRKCRGRPSHCR